MISEASSPGERIDEDQLVLRHQAAGGVDVHRDLLRVGHHEREHVVRLALERILSERTQRRFAIERLAQQQVRQAAVVLNELLLARLRDRNGRDRVRAVIVVRALPDLITIVLLPVKPAPLAALLELQAIVLQVQQQRFLLRAGFERRRGGRHLQARPVLAFEPQTHDLDRAQRLGAADCVDRTIEHRTRRCLRALGQGFGIVRLIVRLGVHGARRQQ